MPLDDLRKKIDSLDSELLRLLNERADVVHGIGEAKKQAGLMIYAPEREEALLQALARKNAALQGRLPEKSVRAIYREIMSAALALEDDLKIAYLGPEGTWTHQAALNKFGRSVEYVPKPSFEDVFDEVARRRAHYGVVPIENSTDGSITDTIDAFLATNLRIINELHLRVRHHLMSKVPRDQIKRIEGGGKAEATPNAKLRPRGRRKKR